MVSSVGRACGMQKYVSEKRQEFHAINAVAVAATISLFVFIATTLTWTFRAAATSGFPLAFFFP